MYRFAVIVLAFLSVAYSQVVSAQGALADKAYRLFLARVTTYQSGTYTFATTGAVLASTVPPVFSAPTFTAGGATVAAASRVAVGAGATAAVSVVGSASGPAVFSAFRALTGGPLGLAILASPIIIDWLSGSGVRIDPATGVVQRRTTGSSGGCTGSNELRLVWQGYSSAGYFCTPELASASWVAAVNAGGVYRETLQRCEGFRCYFTFEEIIGGRTGTETNADYDARPVSSSGGTVWQASTYDDISPYMDKPTPPAVFQALLDAGAKIEVVPRFINGPEYVPLPKTVEVTDTPTKTITKETTKGIKLEYKTGTDPITGQPAPSVEASPKDVVTVKEKDKVTGEEKLISTTTTETGEKPKSTEEIETCGLPGKPKCLIDETGTPEKKDYEEQKKVDDIFKPVKEIIASPETSLPSLPSLNWAFQLPTGCTAISLPAFAPWLQGIDICPFLPMFHDIMSVIWVIGGLFGAIGTFWRNVFSQT